MALPNLDLSLLSIHDPGPSKRAPDPDRSIRKYKEYIKSIPYADGAEPESKLIEMLEFIVLRLEQCVASRDYEVGFLQWDSMLSYWSLLKYPIPKETRIKLAKIYWYMSTTPGMPGQIMATCADGFKSLTQSVKKLTIKDMRLPWRPVYEILSKDLFLTRRQFEYTQLPWVMGYIAANSRRFFHPAAANEMLSTFVPLINNTDLDYVLAAQFYLLTFLPLSHPQAYLPMLFRIWESINSYMFDERMLEFLASLCEMHVASDVSDPRKLAELPDDAKSEGEGRPQWSEDDLNSTSAWPGIYKDVGVFTEHEWSLLMCKCINSMEIPLADGGSLTTGPSADRNVAGEIGRLPKPEWRIQSLARIIVYSMAPDGMPSPASNAPTPLFTPLPSGMNTPQIPTNNSLRDYLSAPLAIGPSKNKTYLAGCKALESLSQIIASTESFFHPSNSGSFTNDLAAFIKQIAYDFNRRWLEEQQPECKTPMNRRLTKQMKRELVKTLRTVAFLAMFCEDSNTVSNIQSCLKSMSVMEPDLILHPILERAVPALETLIETQRTIAVIKALGAVAPAIVSRKVYYPGAKHLIPILQLLIPGIDLNDPTKTLHTTEFIVEVAQYIMFADAMPDDANGAPASRPETPPDMPSFFMDESDREFPRLTDEEEDRLVQDTTGSFADWVTHFIRRVYQLQESLPEEGGGAAEVQVVDAVGRACMSICSHLSPSLYDLVLNLVYDYASTTVRSNAVRGIHLLIEALANANPVKCLAKFFPLCERSIRIELENGASSLRTTAASSPLPSDATLHWHLAILRGCVFNDGTAILPYKDRLISLLKLLNEKTFSNRGFAWSGKLLCNVLLTLSHTYPLENKFVNPEEWNSEEFRRKHYLYWGKVYKADEVTVSWHVPNAEEIDFACQIFRELVEPALNLLIKLLDPGEVRNTVWSNDFCRHLSFVSNAFSGIPTLIRDVFKPDALRAATKTSDILYEIEEMIGVIEPMNSGFVLTDPADPRYAYLSSLRRRFGEFLHDASRSLSQQGEENTVDAVEMLIEGIRTYMLEYGDSKEQGCEKKYNSEKNVARLIAKQRTWPRSVWVRRARFYHSARLRWNSLERLRGPLEDLLIDDLVEWSLWNYATIRSYSQSILDSICVVYDGVRRRAFPVLYQALESVDDDRMKGALWTLNLMNFGKYAASELTLAPKLVQSLFLCQKNEKPSIQDCVSVVSENCLNSLPEPCSLVYDVETPELDAIFAGIGFSKQDQQLIQKCTDNRKLRVRLMDESAEELMSSVLAIGNSSKTHWKYEIAAIRCLRAIIRRDAPLDSDRIRYFLEKTRDSNPSMRYYAQRAVMKALRNLKLRTFCRKPTDLILGRNHNPLKERVPIEPSPELTRRFLDAYKVPLDLNSVKQGPVFVDKDPLGWLTWSRKQSFFRIPDAMKSTFQPWEPASDSAIAAVREITLNTEFWKELGMYFSEENHELTIIMDNVSLVKSIFQLLEDEPFEALKPTVEALVSDKEPDKQRALAEFTAGLIGGSKHWPLSKQDVLWKWFKPIMADIFGPNLKTDTVSIWTSFLEYISYNKDPRRLQPLVDHLMNIWMHMDYQPELAFDTTKLLSVLKGFAETINWKFTAWTDQVVARCWSQLELTEHEEIRSSIADILAFSSKIKATPRPSFPTTEVFVKECRILPVDYDIMGMRGYYHKARIAELVNKFPVWREERAPGVRAFQSTYDRVGITVCKFLFQLLLDTSAIRVFDYILPLMPELFRFTEVNDNEDLATRGNDVLVQMCGVSPPRSLINPIFDAIFEAIQNSPSWRVRIKALPLVQVFYFRQLPLVSEGKMMEILEVLCKCLDDEVVDVREMAATTLSGILRLSPRRHILKLRDRFVQLIKKSHIPARQDPGYARGVRQRHAAILGVCALVDSVPYTVEKWTPDLLTNILAEHTYDPAPISTTVRKCARNFSRTHRDTWHEDCIRFSEDQLAMLSNLLTGSSYYA